jgi:hypothetical protein
MTEKTAKIINESTLLPISLVITLAGGIIWLSALWYREEVNAASITEIKQVIKDDKAILREDIKLIHEKLDRIMERLSK